MAKFLITVWPFSGHFNATVAIAHALRERGHQVAYYTGSRACRVAEQEGYLCYPFRHVDEERQFGLVLSQEPGTSEWQGHVKFRTTLRGLFLETVPQQVQDLEPVLAEWQPDVIVTDPTMWSSILIFHEARGIPVAIASFMPSSMLPGPDAPPFGLGLPRPRNWYTRLLSWAVASGLGVFAAEFRRTANSYRKSHGLPPLPGSIIEHLGRMPLYLIPGVPELDYERRDLPPSVHYVGPYLWDKPRDAETTEWLADVPRDQPWVHVTEGTLHKREPVVLRAAAQGLANLPMQVIMTTGPDRDPAELGLGPIAPNVHVVRFVPHSELLPLTDVYVGTGGGLSTLAALNAGVPLVIIPTEWDKPENARRVVESGTGLRLAPRRVTPGRLREAVMRLLSEPSFRQNARRMSAAFARCGGAERAARLIEGLCAEGDNS